MTNTDYNNHELYLEMIGHTKDEFYELSQRILDGRDRNDLNEMVDPVFIDKEELKKWEKELGIRHDELELPWDNP